MLVRMKCSIAYGIGRQARRGQIIEVSAADGLRLIQTEQAEAAPAADIETASIEPPQNAAKRTGRTHGRAPHANV